MMLDPSIDELMAHIDSKYMLVTLSAKRARELREAGLGESGDMASRKYIGTALKEITEGKLTYTSSDD